MLGYPVDNLLEIIWRKGYFFRESGGYDYFNSIENIISS